MNVRKMFLKIRLFNVIKTPWTSDGHNLNNVSSLKKECFFLYFHVVSFYAFRDLQLDIKMNVYMNMNE